MTTYIYLDTETTGLDSSDEIVEIAIIGNDRNVLLNTLVKPTRHTSWNEAEDIHGITPAMVADAPTYEEIAETVKALVTDQEVVIYNAAYDSRYIPELEYAKSVHCCMLAFAEEYGDWNDYHQSFRWKSLSFAFDYLEVPSVGDAHRALADTRMTRAVWMYLTDPYTRKLIKAHIANNAARRSAISELNSIAFKEKVCRYRAQKESNKRIIQFVYGYPARCPDTFCWITQPEAMDRFDYHKLFTGYKSNIWDMVLHCEENGLPIFEIGDIPKGLVSEKESGRYFTPGKYPKRIGLAISKRKARAYWVYNKRSVARLPKIYTHHSKPSDLATATDLQRKLKIPKKIRDHIKPKAYLYYTVMNESRMVPLYPIPMEYQKTKAE